MQSYLSSLNIAFETEPLIDCFALFLTHVFHPSRWHACSASDLPSDISRTFLINYDLTERPLREQNSCHSVVT
jgi:poly-D-alanine transfer protein DltD